METPRTVAYSDDERILAYERAIQDLSQELQECRRKLGQPMGRGLFGQGGKRRASHKKYSKKSKKSRKMRHRKTHRKN